MSTILNVEKLLELEDRLDTYSNRASDTATISFENSQRIAQLEIAIGQLSNEKIKVIDFSNSEEFL